MIFHNPDAKKSFSEIEDFARFLHDSFTDRVICVCHVIPRGESCLGFACFNSKAPVVNQCLRALLEQFENVFCWYDNSFSNPSYALF